jgi:ferredoxin
MKVTVDRTRCTGLGICESIAPGTFEVDDDSTLEILTTEICTAELQTIEQAVRVGGLLVSGFTGASRSSRAESRRAREVDVLIPVILWSYFLFASRAAAAAKGNDREQSLSPADPRVRGIDDRFGNQCASPDRGRCDHCGQPFIETIGGSAGMVFIPAATFEDPGALPPAQRQIYSRLREQDVSDRLPKHHYFATSQFAIARMIGRVLRHG